MSVIDHKCPGCGSPLKFNPKGQNWTCKYCGGSFGLDKLIETKSVKDIKFDKKMSDVYNCPDCGASLITDKYTSATNCVYCGNVALLKSKLSNEFHPDKILPFKIDKNDVIEIFKNFQTKNIFMPKLFNNQNNIENITGVYVPFWLVDAKANAKYTLNAIQKKEWSVNNIEYLDVNKYELEREAILDFSNIPLDGSIKFNDDMMHSLEPFDFKELKDFNYAYLSGFLAEIYDSNADNRFDTIDEMIIFCIEQLLKEKEKNYDVVDFKDKNIDLQKYNVRYCLLPVWMVNVKYGGNNYLLAVNGQTGKMIGRVPINMKKVIFVFLITFIVIYSVFMVLAR